MSTFGFNIIGPASATSGTGVALRHLIGLLLDKGYPLAILERGGPEGEARGQHPWLHLSVEKASKLPYAVNIHSENLLWAHRYFLEAEPGMLRPERLNVGLLWWELPVLPPHCAAAAGLYDALLCPSRFIEHSFAFNLSGPSVVGFQHPVELPRPLPAADRARFGLPADALLFVSSLEPNNGCARKNPLGALRAFQRAFPDRGDSRQGLVLKLNRVGLTGAGNSAVQALLSELNAAQSADPRIHVIDETLDYASVLALYAACDVFVSLHRSEGLGLGPAEAMQLGRCVLATGWSGNMSYMDAASACLVRHSLVPCSEDVFYSRAFTGVEGYWAEPDLDDAARWMRELAADPALRRHMGEAARVKAMHVQRTAREAAFAPALERLWHRHKANSTAVPRYRQVAPLWHARAMHAESTLPPLRRWSTRVRRQAREAYAGHIAWRLKKATV